MIGRIAAYTLGCKVNQYDTEAMLGLFEKAGWQVVDPREAAQAYLINTCTVTNTGDLKSLKLIRRLHRERPEAEIIVCGCLAQRDARRVALPGVRLILGVRRRSEVVTLFEKALAEGACLDATDAQGSWTFERLPVDRHGARTRATLKIQEGCDRYCAYCVIPYVRGPVRSMPLEDVAAQARALAEAGYREVVITGIHLASYGRESGETLLDAISAAAAPAGIRRVRLGSLEPVVVTEPFVEGLEKIGKICPQFHLSLQSGSESVLRRMRRRYTPDQYLAAARLLQAAWRPAALTTDVLTGFPGETPEEAAQTEAFVEEVGFAHLHVFPYSRRAGTLADRMPGQVSESVRQERCRRLIDIGNRLEARFVQELIGSVREVLFETPGPAGTAEGYTPEYVRVRAVGRPGEIRPALLTGIDQGIALGQSGEEL